MDQPLRRSRRLAGLPPDYSFTEDQPRVNVKKEVLAASFTGTLIGMVVMTGAVVFALWN